MNAWRVLRQKNTAGRRDHEDKVRDDADSIVAALCEALRARGASYGEVKQILDRSQFIEVEQFIANSKITRDAADLLRQLVFVTPEPK